MLFWWMTLCCAVEPLFNMVTRILLTLVLEENNGTSLQTGTDASAVSLMSSTDASTTPEMSLITGIYTFESEDNFQKYLKKLGVPYVLRSLASMATPVITISKNCQDIPADRDDDDGGCDWTMRTDTLFKSHTLKFRLGVPGTDVTMDGRRVGYVIHKTGANQLTEEQTSDNTKTKIVRDFAADRMDVSMSVDDVVGSSVFRRSHLGVDD